MGKHKGLGGRVCVPLDAAPGRSWDPPRAAFVMGGWRRIPQPQHPLSAPRRRVRSPGGSGAHPGKPAPVPQPPGLSQPGKVRRGMKADQGSFPSLLALGAGRAGLREHLRFAPALPCVGLGLSPSVPGVWGPPQRLRPSPGFEAAAGFGARVVPEGHPGDSAAPRGRSVGPAVPGMVPRCHRELSGLGTEGRSGGRGGAGPERGPRERRGQPGLGHFYRSAVTQSLWPHGNTAGTRPDGRVGTGDPPCHRCHPLAAVAPPAVPAGVAAGTELVATARPGPPRSSPRCVTPVSPKPSQPHRPRHQRGRGSAGCPQRR